MASPPLPSSDNIVVVGNRNPFRRGRQASLVVEISDEMYGMDYLHPRTHERYLLAECNIKLIPP